MRVEALQRLEAVEEREQQAMSGSGPSAARSRREEDAVEHSRSVSEWGYGEGRVRARVRGPLAARSRPPGRKNWHGLTHRVLPVPSCAGVASPARNEAWLKRGGAIKAEEERGEEVRAAAKGARGAAEAEQDAYGEEVQGAQAAHLEAVAEAEKESAEAQKAEREKAQDEVRGARGAWAGEQDASLLEKDEEASLELKEAAEEIREKKQTGEEQAAEEIQEGNEAARVAQERGEQEAEAEKQKGERESEGFFGWVARKAKAFFAKVQKAISQALERARALVRESLEKAKRFAVGLIEKARKAVVGLIQQAGKALIALGGALLADFPALREKWTQAIESVVAGAEAGINRLADALKTTVVSLLDTLGGALDGALGLLDRGLRAAVGLVAKAVDGALQFAQGLADKLGVFADLVGDIAGDPLGWLRNLGSSIKDGLENHLWTELKAAVTEWFGSKVEGLLSVGKTVWSLVTGELGLSAVLQMAWKEVQAMLPKALAEILVQKLMAMLVPAAGALLAIVEALQAAWGTVSRMIASIELFVSFLKAVKGGGAGKKFAIALASAAVVVLDFVANYLLRKIGDGLRKLSGKLRGLAQHLQKKQRAKKAKSRRGSQVRRARAGGRKGAKRKEKRRLGPLEQVPLPDGTFGERLAVKVGEERHQLISLEPGGGRIEVRSSPQSLSAFLREEAKKATTEKDKRLIVEAREQGARALIAARSLANFRKKRVRKKGNEEAWKAKWREVERRDVKLERELRKLRDIMSRILHTIQINVYNFKWKNRYGGLSRRPDFSDATRKFLDDARKRGTEHQPESSSDVLIDKEADKKSYHRRHIVAFSETKRNYQNSLDQKPYDVGRRFLQSRGAKEKMEKNPQFVHAARTSLEREFNNVEGLFVADARENMRLGRELWKAQRRADKVEQEIAKLQAKNSPADEKRLASLLREKKELETSLAGYAVDMPSVQQQTGDARKGFVLGDRIETTNEELGKIEGSMRGGDGDWDELNMRVSSVIDGLMQDAQRAGSKEVGAVRKQLTEAVRMRNELGRRQSASHRWKWNHRGLLGARR